MEQVKLLLLGITVGVLMGISLSVAKIAKIAPVDLVGLVNKYEAQITELKKERELADILKQDDEEYVQARCVCKDYSGPTNGAGQYIESLPENRQLTPQQICEDK